VPNWFETPLGQARVKEWQESAAKSNAHAEISAKRQHSSGNGRGMRTRMYETARSTRLNSGWTVSNTSADAELASSLTALRARSRQLVRDSSYAKRARLIVVNNVIGNGIGLQAQVKTTRDKLNLSVNDQIEESWAEWSEAQNCHTGGRLAFYNFERVLMAQVFDAGEVLIRYHHETFGTSKVPLGLELIEAERLADDLTVGSFNPQNGNEIRMGIEVNKFFRPVAYYIRRRPPNDVRWPTGNFGSDLVERVPADEIEHLAVVDRWPQTRGEPWLHAAARRLNDVEGYSEAEIVRARGQSVRLGFIKSSEDAESFGEKQEDGTVEMEYEAGIITKLNPGEEFQDLSPTSPNPQFDPFMRVMIREIAAGSGPSYESISRDYSQSNYSSSRLALLEDRDLWRFYQCWFIGDFRRRLHRKWLQQAVLARDVPGISVEQYAFEPRKFEKVLYKPRGWTWIDPNKEVQAFKEAIRAGFTTRTDVIAATAGGQDIEDVDGTRERELKDAKEKGLEFDTDPDYYMADAVKAAAAAKTPKPDPEDSTGDPPDGEEEAKPNSAPPKAGRAVLGVVK
jgi:lambda family phage portal protein